MRNRLPSRRLAGTASTIPVAAEALESVLAVPGGEVARRLGLPA